MLNVNVVKHTHCWKKGCWHFVLKCCNQKHNCWKRRKVAGFFVEMLEWKTQLLEGRLLGFLLKCCHETHSCWKEYCWHFLLHCYESIQRKGRLLIVFVWRWCDQQRSVKGRLLSVSLRCDISVQKERKVFVWRWSDKRWSVKGRLLSVLLRCDISVQKERKVVDSFFVEMVW